MPDADIKAVVADGVEVELDPAAARANENIGEKIIAGGAWRSAAYAVSTVVAVIGTAIISREIGPEGFAQFTTALSLLTVAFLISDVGLLALGVREYAAFTGERRRRAFRAMITLRTGFGFLAGAVILAFVVLAGYTSGFVVGMVAAALSVPLFSYATSANVPLQGEYRLNHLAGLDVLRQVLTSGLMVAAALITGKVGAVVAMNLPTALGLGVAAALVVRRISPMVPSWDPPVMRGLMLDVGAFAVASGVGSMYPFVSQVVSDSVLPSFESGQFALAFRVYAVLLAGWVVVVSGAFPLLVTSSREDVERMVFAARRLLQTSMLAGVACAAGLIAGADFAASLLGGSEYSEAAKLIAIIALALPATFTLITGNSVLLASGRHRELIVVSVAGALASIGITWAAATQWGGEGASAGVVVGEMLLAAGYLWMVHKIDRRALPKVWWMLRTLICGAVAAAAALTGLPSLLAAILAGIIFVAGGLLLRILPPEVTARIPFVRSEPAQ